MKMFFKILLFKKIGRYFCSKKKYCFERIETAEWCRWGFRFVWRDGNSTTATEFHHEIGVAQGREKGISNELMKAMKSWMGKWSRGTPGESLLEWLMKMRQVIGKQTKQCRKWVLKSLPEFPTSMSVTVNGGFGIHSMAARWIRRESDFYCFHHLEFDWFRECTTVWGLQSWVYN